MKQSGKHDPGEIVIDEVAGIWLVFCIMPLMWMQPPTSLILWLYAAGFMAFRFFDIVKPWPISWVDRKVKGGFGVMVDDAVAALFACVTLGALGHLATAMEWIEIHVR
jgi:phosphatidylglycerophosphatase A